MNTKKNKSKMSKSSKKREKRYAKNPDFNPDSNRTNSKYARKLAKRRLGEVSDKSPFTIKIETASPNEADHYQEYLNIKATNI